MAEWGIDLVIRLHKRVDFAVERMMIATIRWFIRAYIMKETLGFEVAFSLS